jgi:hypothetical protein
LEQWFNIRPFRPEFEQCPVEYEHEHRVPVRAPRGENRSPKGGDQIQKGFAPLCRVHLTAE